MELLGRPTDGQPDNADQYEEVLLQQEEERGEGKSLKTTRSDSDSNDDDDEETPPLTFQQTKWDAAHFKSPQWFAKVCVVMVVTLFIGLVLLRVLTGE
jgi:hypothetical protein